MREPVQNYEILETWKAGKRLVGCQHVDADVGKAEPGNPNYQMLDNFITWFANLPEDG